LEKKLGRKVVFFGRSLSKYTTAARNVGKLPFKNDIEVYTYRRQREKAFRRINKNKKDYVVVCTGHQGEPGAILDRLSRNELPLKLSADDHIIFSSKTIPTPINELSREQLERRLKKFKVRIFDNVHVSGHGGRDIKSEQRDFSDVIEGSIKGVVSIGTEKSAGSGFIVNESGYIVTNRHVILGAKQIRILTFDRKTIPAFLVGEDAFRDIALLRVPGIYSPLELAESDEQEVGEKVIAIGNPLGLSFSVTEGIISAVHRVGPNGLSEYIQTDVSLNPGNSGGPLINTDGEVVGINNFKIGGAEGLGFALESNSIKFVINDLADKTIV